MILEFKIFCLLSGIILGFSAGTLGATVGDHFVNELSSDELECLKKSSRIFRVVSKLELTTYIFATPIGFIPMISLGVILKCFWPGFFLFLETYEKILIPGLLIYLCSLFVFYIVGLFWCAKLQDKYLKK